MTIRGNMTYNRYRVRRNTTEPGFSFIARSDQVSQVLLIPGIEGTRFLLNKFTGAAVAYSLRLMRREYTGACIRVRRSSDSTEQDIGFVSGFVDTASLLTFCGAGDGFVATWYDQTANGRNKTMATTTKQPRIVTAGALEFENGRACVVTDGSDDELVSADYITTNLTDMTLFSVVRFSSTVGLRPIYGKYLTTGNQRSFFMGVRDGNWWAQFALDGTTANVTRIDANSQPPSNQNLSVIRIDATQATATNRAAFRRNGVAATNASAFGTNATLIFDATAPIGIASNGSGGEFAGLRLQELVLWLDNQSANTPGIEQNMNRFWRVY